MEYNQFIKGLEIEDNELNTLDEDFFIPTYPSIVSTIDWYDRRKKMKNNESNS